MSKNRCIKVFAWLLSVIMIFSMMPVAVLAEEPVKDVNTSAPKTEDTIGGSVTLPFILEEPGASSDETLNGASGGSSGEMKFNASLEYIRTEDAQSVSMAEGDPDPNKDYVIRIEFDPNGAAFNEIHDFGFRLDYVKVTGTPDPNGPYTYEVDEENKTIAFHWQNTTGERPSFTLDIPCKPAFPEPDGWNFKGNEYAIVANASNASMMPDQEWQNNKSRRILRSASCTLLGGKIRNNNLSENPYLWKFNHVSGSWYSISSDKGNIRFYQTNGMELTDELYAAKVERKSSTQIVISDGYGKYLTNTGNNPATGFGAYATSSSKGQEMNLYTSDQFTKEPTKPMSNGLAIVNDSLQTLLTTEANGNSLKTAAYNLVANGKVLVKDAEGKPADVTTWIFEPVEGDWYNIKSGEQYINLSQGKLTLSGSPQPIFVRHIEGTTDQFALADHPYNNTGNVSQYKSQANLVQYVNQTASAYNKQPSGAHHKYENSGYNESLKLRLRPAAGAEDDYLLLTLDYNCGTVTNEAPVKTKAKEARDAAKNA